MRQSDTNPRARLYNNLLNHFEREELKELCYIYMGIDPEIFSSEDKRTMVRELIERCEKTRRIEEFLSTAKRLRPDIGNWPKASELIRTTDSQEFGTRTEYEIATDRQHEDALQRYLDQMTELLLEKGLRKSEKEAEVRDVARIRTLAVLRGLDGERKGILVKYLYEAGLIRRGAAIVNLRDADLSKVNLRGATLFEWPGPNIAHGIGLAYTNMVKADLRETILWDVDLRLADLTGADLTDADLREAKLGNVILTDAILANTSLKGATLIRANLTGANLEGANLTLADLTDATVTDEQLSKAKSLAGTIFPDGTRHFINSPSDLLTDPHPTPIPPPPPSDQQPATGSEGEPGAGDRGPGGGLGADDAPKGEQ